MNNINFVWFGDVILTGESFMGTMRPSEYFLIVSDDCFNLTDLNKVYCFKLKKNRGSSSFTIVNDDLYHVSKRSIMTIIESWDNAKMSKLSLNIEKAKNKLIENNLNF